MNKAGLLLTLAAATAHGLAPFHSTEKAIPGQYVVVLKKDADIPEHMRAITERMTLDSPANELLHQYNIGDFKGYALLCTQKVVDVIRQFDAVEAVYEDGLASISGTQNNPPSWGLDRISQRNLPLDKAYHYPDTAGSGVNMYTLDTGIYISHNDFGGRAKWGANFVSGSGNDDRQGHGTHCSGTMAGTSYGVAKKATIYAVKVLGDNGSGAYSGIIAGVDWVVAQSGSKKVGNMSLGGGAYTALDTAVNNAVNAGVHMAVAAGNDNANACNYSPARANGVTVGSTTNTDAKSSFSNWGTCVDINAPGSNIVSTYIGSSSATATLSGTSMAAPHVAGVMAIYLGAGKTPSKATLQNASTKNVITGLPSGTVNYLLYTSTTVSSEEENIAELL